MTISRSLLMFACIVGVVALGAVSGIASGTGLWVWYATLQKPFFNPPSWVFGPVWTILYALMGFALYRIWIMPSSSERLVLLSLFTTQLILNLAWSFLFFYFQRPDWALVEIILLWGFILWLIIRLYPLDKLAAGLQIPYLLWVSFATLLNAALWWLNRS